MDDIIILVENRQQYRRARKRLFDVLRKLRLSVSPHKTRMGTLKRGFHFLGVDFEVSRNPQKEIQAIKVGIHPRTCRRALAKVEALRNNAVHPATIQRYLRRWAAWWDPVCRLGQDELIKAWTNMAAACQPADAWVGRGLLIGTPAYECLTQLYKRALT